MTFENNINTFIKNLKQFDHKVEYKDLMWKVIFPDKKLKFHYIHVTKYQDTHYIGLVDGNLCTLEVKPDKKVEVAPSFGVSRYDDGSDDPAAAWNDLISTAIRWLNTVKKDWIKANKQVHEGYPLNRRYGIVPNALIRASLPDIYRIDKVLGKTKIKKFVRLFEDAHFENEDNFIRKTMTANDYFDYCKIAYIAAQEKEGYVDKNLSGRQMYECYADGRDNGLLDIAGDSKKEFADWIDGKHPKKTSGGHPWEIKRGGNTTHIDLYVTRPRFRHEENFIVSLNGPSIGRLKETLDMFLALHEAEFPITIANAKGIYKRLLALDNIGIIPCFDSLHRANQRFHEHENVFDVLHYDDLGKYKRRIKPFITWEPMPILKPTM